MTDPRSKKKKEAGEVSVTTRTYAENWIKEQIYGYQKDIKSKYLDKGNVLEDKAIDTIIDWLDLDFTIKNEQSFEDEFFTGTPDLILDDEIIDVKCSWDCFTFPLFEDEIPTKDYYYQLQIYMHLTGKKKSRLCYVLLDTPDNLEWEKPKTYSHLNKKYRLKSYKITYDEGVISDLQKRVKAIRGLINNEYKIG